MAHRRLQFAPMHRALEGCACGGSCAGCASGGRGLYGLGDFTETRNEQTGVYTTEYKSGGVDPGMGTKMVLDAFSDLFTGKREKDASRAAAERLAKIQAGSDTAVAQQRAMAAERWSTIAPWALMTIGVLGVGVILLKVSKS